MINAWAFLNYWGHVPGLPPKSTPMPICRPNVAGQKHVPEFFPGEAFDDFLVANAVSKNAVVSASYMEFLPIYLIICIFQTRKLMGEIFKLYYKPRRMLISN